MLEIIVIAQPKKVCDHYNKHSLSLSCPTDNNTYISKGDAKKRKRNRWRNRSRRYKKNKDTQETSITILC